VAAIYQILKRTRFPNGSPEKLINKSPATSTNERITHQKKPAGRSTSKESAKKVGNSVGRGKRKQIKDHEGNHHDLFTFECLSRQTLDPHLWFDWRPPHTFLEYFIGYVQLRKQIYMTLNWKVLTCHSVPFRFLNAPKKTLWTPQTLLKDWWKFAAEQFWLSHFLTIKWTAQRKNSRQDKWLEFLFYVHYIYTHVPMYLTMCICGKLLLWVNAYNE